MKNRTLILASASPRRRRLLAEMGVAFEVVVPQVDEVHYLDDLHGSVRENAALKCAWCRERHPEASILAADTGIEFEGRTIMKPGSREEAAAFLRLFSGQTHTVMTGVAFSVPGAEMRLHVESSRVRFRELSDEMITAYIEKVDPLDRAGAYDINECGEMIVEGYKGSYTNIVGLPCEIVELWVKAHREGHEDHGGEM
jgi:septum formation protein